MMGAFVVHAILIACGYCMQVCLVDGRALVDSPVKVLSSLQAFLNLQPIVDFGQLIRWVWESCLTHTDTHTSHTQHYHKAKIVCKIT